MTKDEQLLQKRFIELSRAAWQRGIPRFTGFLNLNEQNILHTTPKDQLSCGFCLYGGYEFSERQMAAFLPDALSYENPEERPENIVFPLSAVKIAPLNQRFAEEITHRDLLGAVMNLGIERSRTGDILLTDDGYYMFVAAELAGFVGENLTRVRHTAVSVTPADPQAIHYKPHFELKQGTVPSVRLDTVLSVGFPLSRSKITPLIEGGKVFVNGKLVTSNGHPLQEGDILSVRGLGRIEFSRVLSKTKKGRFLIEIREFQ